jgi:hypothetical protein
MLPHRILDRYRQMIVSSAKETLSGRTRKAEVVLYRSGKGRTTAHDPISERLGSMGDAVWLTGSILGSSGVAEKRGQ